MWVSPHHPPAEKRARWWTGKCLRPVCWSVVVLGCCVAGVLDPCGGGQMIRSDVSLVAGYWRLGAWVVGRRRCADWSGETTGEWVRPGQLVVRSCREVRRGCRRVRLGQPIVRRGVVIRRGCRLVSPSGQPIIRRGAEKSGVAADEWVRPVRPIVRRSAVGCFCSCWWWADGECCCAASCGGSRCFDVLSIKSRPSRPSSGSPIIWRYCRVVLDWGTDRGRRAVRWNGIEYEEMEWHVGVPTKRNC